MTEAICAFIIICLAILYFILALYFDNRCKHNYEEIDRVLIEPNERITNIRGAESIDDILPLLTRGAIITYRCKNCGKLDVVRALNTERMRSNL